MALRPCCSVGLQEQGTPLLFFVAPP